ncbi:MAG: hypothetical protein Q9163_005812 [Psora crenata]
MCAQELKEHYQALVDMGSNGIRFSITDLSPPTARILPTVYQDRSPISLYDAQYADGSKIPIPEPVIQDVLAALLRFKKTCHEFGVPEDHIRVVATEATRNATNSQDFLRQIEQKMGREPHLLSKEEEGRLGALGVASSVDCIEGLVMDMGGGSVQLTWVSKSRDGSIYTGPRGSISLPYGAAALMSRIDGTTSQSKQTTTLDELVFQFEKSLRELQLPPDGRLSLYLSGGGFRGWGHILMSMDAIRPYPIPLINGYRVGGDDLPFMTCPSSITPGAHRISKRRASQLPAIQLVITAVLQALPSSMSLEEIIFCQGGVREGLLFADLVNDVRIQHPLVAATQPHAPSSVHTLLALLQSATPKNAPTSFALLVATISLLYTHASHPKDIRSAAALRSTSTGILSNVHGLLHGDRAMLALILCERWGGHVPLIETQYFGSLQAVVGSRASWWAKYIGRIARGIGEFYPAGIVQKGEEAVKLGVTLADDGSVDDEGGKLDILYVAISDVRDYALAVAKRWAKDLKKLGGEKNWVNSKDGWKINVQVEIFQRQTI